MKQGQYKYPNLLFTVYVTNNTQILFFIICPCLFLIGFLNKWKETCYISIFPSRKEKVLPVCMWITITHFYIFQYYLPTIYHYYPY